METNYIMLIEGVFIQISKKIHFKSNIQILEISCSNYRNYKFVSLPAKQGLKIVTPSFDFRNCQIW